jgi:hypothetical protein
MNTLNTLNIVKQTFGIVVEAAAKWNGKAPFKLACIECLASNGKVGLTVVDYLQSGKDDGFVGNYVKTVLFNRLYDTAVLKSRESLGVEDPIGLVDPTVVAYDETGVILNHKVTVFHNTVAEGDATDLITDLLLNIEEGLKKGEKARLARARADELYAAKLVIEKAETESNYKTMWFDSKQLVSCLESHHRDVVAVKSGFAEATLNNANFDF